MIITIFKIGIEKAALTKIKVTVPRIQANAKNVASAAEPFV